MILIRPYKESDHDFICSSYLKSTYYNSVDKTTRMVNQLDHDKAMDRKINAMLAQSLTLVACPEDDPDTIVGYVIFTHDCLHYIYVKRDFRRMGICNELKKASDFGHYMIFSHLSKDAIDLCKQKNIIFNYNPYKVLI